MTSPSRAHVWFLGFVLLGLGGVLGRLSPRWLAQLAERRESLETRARQAAEQTLQAAAEEGGILKRAEESVARTVSSLVRALGFDAVRVDFQERS